MVNVPVITRKELVAFFLSPTAYIVLTAFALAQGILFALVLQPPVDPERTLEWLLMVPVYLLIVAAPVLTMRLLAEEASTGSLEALMTAPVSETEVVLGKFAGALVFATAMFLPAAAQAGYLGLVGRVDAGVALAGFMGLFLLTAQYLAVGLLCSALTRAQIGAAIMSFTLLLSLYLGWFLARGSESAGAAVLSYLAPPWHYLRFTRGTVDTRDLAYFVLTCAAFLFLAVKALQARKWR